MISLVTPYKNRRHHLEKTIPSWICQEYSEPYQIVLVDYESDDDVSLYFNALDFAKPISILHIRCNECPHFHLAHARNIGSRYAAGDILFFIDIDTYLRPGALAFVDQHLTKSTYLAAADSQVRKEIVNGGLIVVHASSHDAVFGFNENIKGWGFEDIDYKRRIEKFGLQFQNFSASLYECIDHSNEERTKFYETDKEISWTKNRQIALQQWEDRRFGLWKNIITRVYE